MVAGPAVTAAANRGRGAAGEGWWGGIGGRGGSEAAAPDSGGGGGGSSTLLALSIFTVVSDPVESSAIEAGSGY